jgi:tetratricopeptide (TPR) repeat protein
MMLPVICLGLFASMAGCSGKSKILSEIREYYEAAEYQETIAHCKHALRRDIRDADVYYYYGLALVQLGREYEAYQQLDKAVKIKPALAKPVAETLLDTGRTAFQGNNLTRAGRRVRAAVKYHPSIDLSNLVFVAGDASYQEKDFENAASLLSRAIEAYPDSTAVKRALFRLGVSYERIGLAGEARQTFERFLKDFPRSEYKIEARWKLANLLYEQGEKELENGNFEQAAEIVAGIFKLTDNATLTQKGRFVRGQAFEGLGEFKKAYLEYRAIIDKDQGASGRIVQRAREKIAVLRETGLF